MRTATALPFGDQLGELAMTVTSQELDRVRSHIRLEYGSASEEEQGIIVLSSRKSSSGVVLEGEVLSGDRAKVGHRHMASTHSITVVEALHTEC